MNKFFTVVREMRGFITLWLTQALSHLGSSMTSFALIVWSYQAEGSALSTALLSVCSYAPYVLMSIFAGALSDRWNKKATLIVCDALAALSTVTVLVLLQTDTLRIWHLYVINAVNGLMNTVQQPASEVATSLLTPKKHYQRAASLQQLSNSIVTIATPAIAAALMALAGLKVVLLVDLATFVLAAASLLFHIRLPEAPKAQQKESLWTSVRGGLQFLDRNRGILMLILFLAAINFIASIYNAALPALVLNKADEVGYGILNTCTGVAMLAGSLLSTLLPDTKKRARAVCNTLLISMSTENFFLAFGNSVPVWCIGAVGGWLVIPLMNANLGALMRSGIPVELQGRVYAVRNTLQFFTIPLGYLIGGWLVDSLFEPLMAAQKAGSLLVRLFGTGKGSGAALLFFCIAVAGTLVCLYFRRNKHIRAMDE